MAQSARLRLQALQMSFYCELWIEHVKKMGARADFDAEKVDLEKKVDDWQGERISLRHELNKARSKCGALELDAQRQSQKHAEEKEMAESREVRGRARIAELENDMMHEWARNELQQRQLDAMRQYIEGHRLLGPKFWRHDLHRYVQRNVPKQSPAPPRPHSPVAMGPREMALKDALHRVRSSELADGEVDITRGSESTLGDAAKAIDTGEIWLQAFAGDGLIERIPADTRGLPDDDTATREHRADCWRAVRLEAELRGALRFVRDAKHARIETTAQSEALAEREHDLRQREQEWERTQIEWNRKQRQLELADQKVAQRLLELEAAAASKPRAQHFEAHVEALEEQLFVEKSLRHWADEVQSWSTAQIGKRLESVAKQLEGLGRKPIHAQTSPASGVAVSVNSVTTSAAIGKAAAAVPQGEASSRLCCTQCGAHSMWQCPRCETNCARIDDRTTQHLGAELQQLEEEKAALAADEMKRLALHQQIMAQLQTELSASRNRAELLKAQNEERIASTRALQDRIISLEAHLVHEEALRTWGDELERWNTVQLGERLDDVTLSLTSHRASSVTSPQSTQNGGGPAGDNTEHPAIRQHVRRKLEEEGLGWFERELELSRLRQHDLLARNEALEAKNQQLSSAVSTHMRQAIATEERLVEQSVKLAALSGFIVGSTEDTPPEADARFEMADVLQDRLLALDLQLQREQTLGAANVHQACEPSPAANFDPRSGTA